MRKYPLLILIAFVAGCATAGVERVEQFKPATKIVPLSLMGNNLKIWYVGTTIFQNADREIDVTAWQIDNYIEMMAAQLLQDGGKVTMTPINTDRARKIVGTYVQDLWTNEPLVQGGPESLISLAKEASAEFVLVIGPSLYGDPFFGTIHPITGYGIYQRSFFTKRAINYLTMKVVLFDAKDGKWVARTRVNPSGPRSDSVWMDSENLTLTQADETSTKSSIKQLIEKGLRECFMQLKLIP